MNRNSVASSRRVSGTRAMQVAYRQGSCTTRAAQLTVLTLLSYPSKRSERRQRMLQALTAQVSCTHAHSGTAFATSSLPDVDAGSSRGRLCLPSSSQRSPCACMKQLRLHFQYPICIKLHRSDVRSFPALRLLTSSSPSLSLLRPSPGAHSDPLDGHILCRSRCVACASRARAEAE